MKYFYLLILLAPISLFAESGKELYDDTNCKRCHSDYIFTQNYRKLKTHEELVTRVKRCAVSYADWFEEESMMVADYLDESFYKFSK